MRNASLKRARDNVVLGERMATHLRSSEVAAERIRVIPNWTDETTITPVGAEHNPLRSAWGLEAKFVVAYSGNLGRPHEYGTMLGAAMLLADDRSIAFLMIGDGHHVGPLRAAARAARLNNIVFQPYQPADTLAQSLGAGDVHWISLRPELEGLVVPSKVYGVLAAGRPVIAVTAGDGEIARLIAECGCGLQVDPGDASGFASAVRRLAADPELTSQLGAAARRAATGPFSRATAVAKWRAVLAAASA